MTTRSTLQGAFALILTLVVISPSLAQPQGPVRVEELPPYKAGQVVSGTIRNFGFGLAGVLALWEEGFRKIHPDVRFEDHLPTSDAAIPALVTGVADLAPDGGEATLTETLSFFEIFGYHPTGITVATGAFDVEGRSNGIVVFVNADNPITKLTIKQLDGIFGAERTAGMRGFQWTPSDGRYPLVRNIYIYVNRAPGQALDAKLHEFLRYVLSREGQGLGRKPIPCGPLLTGQPREIQRWRVSRLLLSGSVLRHTVSTVVVPAQFE